MWSARGSDRLATRGAKALPWRRVFLTLLTHMAQTKSNCSVPQSVRTLWEKQSGGKKGQRLAACVILKVEGRNVKRPWQIIQGLWTVILELWGIKLCPSEFSFDCMHPQVWQRPEINPYKDGKRSMQHSRHRASLKRSSLDTGHQLHSYKHVKLLNSSDNWAFSHVLGFRYQKPQLPKSIFPFVVAKASERISTQVPASL